MNDITNMKWHYLPHAIIASCVLAMLFVFSVQGRGERPDTLAGATSTSIVLADTANTTNAYVAPQLPATDTFPLVSFLPIRVNTCTITKVKDISTRLVDGITNKPIVGSGSAINYTDGGYQVSYDSVVGIESSNVADKVRLCLTFIPQNCPPGDSRGRVYQAKNLRTSATWELPDSEHQCGGA